MFRIEPKQIKGTVLYEIDTTIRKYIKFQSYPVLDGYRARH